MRLLVACNQCQRQYDAGERPVGSRFRCHCGSTVVVHEAHGHDASVVRCSSCGAPREENSRSCRFCGGDFTLHERDLHTVCPRCFARVSDGASYCHHCALALTPELVAGDETSRACPACGETERLRSRFIGETTVLECPGCAGMWLGNDTFGQLTARAAAEGAKADHRLNRLSDSRVGRKQKGPRYRNCIECGRMMSRKNYARKSGVIIDVCPQHGVWFDTEELSEILAWIRAGGQARAEEELAAEEHHQRQMERLSRPTPSRTASYEGFNEDGHQGGAIELAEVLAEVFSWLVRR